jgi:hypothetical protein
MSFRWTLASASSTSFSVSGTRTAVAASRRCRIQTGPRPKQLFSTRLLALRQNHRIANQPSFKCWAAMRTVIARTFIRAPFGSSSALPRQSAQSAGPRCGTGMEHWQRISVREPSKGTLRGGFWNKSSSSAQDLQTTLLAAMRTSGVPTFSLAKIVLQFSTLIRPVVAQTVLVQWPRL